MITIRVPATSANMGPGFDCIGMAVNMYNELVVISEDEADLKSHLEIEITNPSEITVPLTEENLIYQSFLHIYKVIGKKPPKVKFIQTDDIPMVRGLGSSAACIVAGMMAANELSGAGLSRDELARIATNIEGHPDNVAPAIFGGMVVGVLENERLSYVKTDIPSDMAFAAMIPDFVLSTEKARGILPESFSMKDTVYNMSRAALLIASIMSGKWENLKVATGDVLHQPYRKGLVAGMDDIFEMAEKAGASGIYLSGAGPTVMAMVKSDRINEFKRMMEPALAGLSCKWDLHILSADRQGATVIKGGIRV